MNLSKMTDAELVAAAQEHDLVYNEGGEGYNPFSAERNRRRFADNTNPTTKFGRKQINTVEDAIDILEGFNIGIGKSSGLGRVPDWEENGRTVTFDEWLTEAHPQRNAALKFLRALAN